VVHGCRVENGDDGGGAPRWISQQVGAEIFGQCHGAIRGRWECGPTSRGCWTGDPDASFAGPLPHAVADGNAGGRATRAVLIAEESADPAALASSMLELVGVTPGRGDEHLTDTQMSGTLADAEHSGRGDAGLYTSVLRPRPGRGSENKGNQRANRTIAIRSSLGLSLTPSPIRRALDEKTGTVHSARQVTPEGRYVNEGQGPPPGTAQREGPKQIAANVPRLRDGSRYRLVTGFILRRASYARRRTPFAHADLP